MLEILLQVIITRQIGVTEYGVYSALVNAADLLYWCLFSGVVKCNTFYLAEEGVTIRKFKQRYYAWYVLPVCLGGIAVALLMARYEVCIVFAVALAELTVMDQSSSLIARKHSKRALFGEYVFGRFLFLTGVVLLFSFSITSTMILALLYLLQYLLISVFFALQNMRMPRASQDRDVSLRKWGNYQCADIIQSMIGQMPVIFQYLVVGSFEAGVVSMVMLVKKLVNFISGPSFKVFLPEFSRQYKAGDRAGIQDSFASIIRMQMLFLAPMAVALAGFSEALLGIIARELIAYRGLFILCSMVFIVIASLGPCSGLLQMTGNERWDNRLREISLAGMLLVMVLLRNDPFFILYALCVQTVVENMGKVIFISRWMGGLPVKMIQYLRLWVLPGLMIGAAYLFDLQESVIAMLLLCGITFAVNLLVEIKTENLLGFFKGNH